MSVQTIVEVRDTLVARLCELANEVGRHNEPPATFEEADAGLRGWGKIPIDTLDEIRELHRNLDVLAGLKSVSGLHAKLAAAPARQVIEALERLIEKVRESAQAA